MGLLKAVFSFRTRCGAGSAENHRLPHLAGLAAGTVLRNGTDLGRDSASTLYFPLVHSVSHPPCTPTGSACAHHTCPEGILAGLAAKASLHRPPLPLALAAFSTKSKKEQIGDAKCEKRHFQFAGYHEVGHQWFEQDESQKMINFARRKDLRPRMDAKHFSLSLSWADGEDRANLGRSDLLRQSGDPVGCPSTTF